MQIADYIAKITGKALEDLFSFSNPLVRLEQDAEGVITIAFWDDSLSVAAPSPEDIMAALAEPDPIVVPASVSARQFKLQLLESNLLDSVEAWIAAQPKAVQISYACSSSFVRSEPMMATGFAAMNFTSLQIDDFYIAASKL